MSAPILPSQAGEAVEIDTQLDEIDMTATAVELVRDKVTQLKESGMEEEAKSLQKAFQIALEKKKKGEELSADTFQMVIPDAELGEDGVQYGEKVEEVVEQRPLPPEGMTVEVQAIRGSTGETITITEDARSALADADATIETYKSLLECVK